MSIFREVFFEKIFDIASSADGEFGAGFLESVEPLRPRERRVFDLIMEFAIVSMVAAVSLFG